MTHSKNQQLTTNNLVDQISNNNLSSARDAMVSMLNSLANEYMDIHKEEVAKSLFQNEDVEQLDELSRKKLVNYMLKNKKEDWRLRKTYNNADEYYYNDDEELRQKARKNRDWAERKLRNRDDGMTLAAKKLTRENIEPLSESKKTKSIKIKNLDKVDEILQGYEHDIDGNIVTMGVKDMADFLRELNDAGIKI